MTNYWHLIVRRCEVGVCVFVFALQALAATDGPEWLNERSVMRCYLGLQALLESRERPEAQRFEWRIQRWYALTDKYRRQLYELDEEEYLDSKRKKRVGWAQLQAEIDGKN